MTKARARTALSTFAITVVVALSLTACGGGDDPSEPTGDPGTTPDAAGPTTEAPATDDSDGGDDDGDSTFVTVSGTGEYAIGTDIPFGGFQLQGEPASQPDGCTWSIVGDDGEVVAENQGSYAFLTDINEADTFVTAGCPDWEQFE